MDTMIAFYKVHYNFAAFCVLALIFGIFMAGRGYRIVLVFVLIGLIGYNVALKRLVETNPVWFDEAMAKAETFDFVDWIWGGGTVNKMKTESENRMNQ